MKYRIENWTSSEGRTETHYFRLKDDEYLFGINPQIVSIEFHEALKEWADEYCD